VDPENGRLPTEAAGSGGPPGRERRNEKRKNKKNGQLSEGQVPLGLQFEQAEESGPPEVAVAQDEPLDQRPV
jgi:hypothetical protein